MTSHWRWYHSLALFLILVVMVVLDLILPDSARLGAWLTTFGLLLAFIAVVGNGITGLWRGALIDERNKMSLSRFQLVLWTSIVLSAFLAAVLANLSKPGIDPLAVGIPQELWLLLGISTTSLVGSPLLKDNKKKRQPDPVEHAYTLNQLADQGTNPGTVGNEGLIVVNATPDMAGWSDMFKGDETGNAALLDIGQLQMFYFTLIGALAYCFALGSQLRTTLGPIDHLPALSSSFLALLGISHAGYLTNKAVPHSDTR